MKKTRIISAFPGVGKTHLCNNPQELDIIDIESSEFSWVVVKGHREPNPNFPNNYIAHIKENMGKQDIILIPSHKVVREALEKEGIIYELYIPDKNSKEEYLERYRERGSDDDFIQLVDKYWDLWLDEIHEEDMFSCKRMTVILAPYMYLSTAIHETFKMFGVVNSLHR